METILTTFIIVVITVIVIFIRRGSNYKKITEAHYNYYVNKKLTTREINSKEIHEFLIDTQKNTVYIDGQVFFKWKNSKNGYAGGWEFTDYDYELKSCTLCPQWGNVPEIVIHFLNENSQTVHIRYEIVKIND